MVDSSDIPRYRKRSNKVVKKSKHKHIYVDCLIYSNSPNGLICFKSSYCNICGKLGAKKWDSVKVEGSKHSRLLSSKEMFEKYKELERFEVEDIYKVGSITLSYVS